MNCNCGKTHLPECEVITLRAQLRSSEAEVARLTSQLENALDSSKEGGWMARALDAERELAAADGRCREGRQLLARMVKYCREDKATTARATRLERLVEQVADYLSRTHEPRDIMRQEKEKADV